MGALNDSEKLKEGVPATLRRRITPESPAVPTIEWRLQYQFSTHLAVAERKKQPIDNLETQT
jgi:hypothetical protein